MFFSNFEAVCKAHNTTVAQVIKSAGIPQGSANYWRNGRFPTLKTVYALAKALGCKPSELVPDEAETDEAAN